MEVEQMSNISQQLEELRQQGMNIILSSGVPVDIRQKLLREIEKKIYELQYRKDHEKSQI